MHTVGVPHLHTFPVRGFFKCIKDKINKELNIIIVKHVYDGLFAFYDEEIITRCQLLFGVHHACQPYTKAPKLKGSPIVLLNSI